MKIIYVEKEVDEDIRCTIPQEKYIRGLMQNTKWSDLYLNYIAFNTRNRLNKVNASRLIDALLKKQEFVIRERKE
jgi:hypothetical protein